MNIEQLENYNLADAVKFHDELNPLLWDNHEQLHPVIREQLMKIAEDFSNFLGVKNLDLIDITISGSNAAYSYTKHSDIDLHLVVDLRNTEHQEIYRELFDAKKAIYNKENKITIKGIPVELYVQDANQAHHSQGIYSVLNNEWLQIPRRKQADIDDISVRSKYEDLSKRIHQVIKSKDITQMNDLMDKIKLIRNAGLETNGEFSVENLVFKLLRNKGDIKKLHTARQHAKNKELSLKERVPTPTRYGYGPDYIEEVGSTPDGTNPSTSQFTDESQLNEVGLTPDGTNPSTSQFTNETAIKHKNIIEDFIDFCSVQLDLEKEINLKIRRDPQWSVRNKTFGRYRDDTNELEVGIAGRHIMDILRTVAHEMVHQKQNEIDPVPLDAGKDGSPYENEANAQAGVLMRRYGKLHPELFMADNLQEASGYIPTAAQAHDPRFEMALTVDVRPGALGKAANSFLLNTDSQGHPQELRPDGLVERMAEDLANFKTGSVLIENTDAVTAHGYAYNRQDIRMAWTKDFPNEAAAKEWARRRNATILSIIKKNKVDEEINEANHLSGFLTRIENENKIWEIEMMVDPYVKVKISAPTAQAAILQMKKRWPGLSQIPNTRFIVRPVKQYSKAE